MRRKFIRQRPAIAGRQLLKRRGKIQKRETGTFSAGQGTKCTCRLRGKRFSVRQEPHDPGTDMFVLVSKVRDQPGIRDPFGHVEGPERRSFSTRSDPVSNIVSKA